MKITREEFKELVGLNEEAWDKVRTYEKIINEEVLYELVFPVINWMRKKLGILEEECDFDVLGDLYTFGHMYIDKDNYSNDLDVIYDRYLGGEENE